MCYLHSLPRSEARKCRVCGSLTLESVLGTYNTKRGKMPPAEWLGTNLFCAIYLIGRCGFRGSLCDHVTLHRKSCKGGKVAHPLREGQGWSEFVLSVPPNLRPQGYCSTGRRNNCAYHLRGTDELSHLVSIVVSIDEKGRYLIRPYTLRNCRDGIDCRMSVHGHPRKTEYTYQGPPNVITSDPLEGHCLIIPAQNMNGFIDKHNLCRITVFLSYEAGESIEARLHEFQFNASIREYEERVRAPISIATGSFAAPSLPVPTSCNQLFPGIFPPMPTLPPPPISLPPHLLMPVFPARMLGVTATTAPSCVPRVRAPSNLVSSSTSDLGGSQKTLPPPPPEAIPDCGKERSAEGEGDEIEVVAVGCTPEKEGGEGGEKRGPQITSPEPEAKRKREETAMRSPASAGPSVANAQLLAQSAQKAVHEGIRVRQREELCGREGDALESDARHHLISKAAPLSGEGKTGEKKE